MTTNASPGLQARTMGRGQPTTRVVTTSGALVLLTVPFSYVYVFWRTVLTLRNCALH